MPKILWQWAAPEDDAPDSYNFYRGEAAGAETLYQAGLTDTQFLDAGVVVGHTYYARVKAVIGGVESGWSNETSLLVPSPPVLVPTLTATPQIGLGNIPQIKLQGY